MGQRNQSRSGLSRRNPAQPRSGQGSPQAVSLRDLEKQAVALIHQNRLEEAEAIYRELIAAGKGNHSIHCNLAAVCFMADRKDEALVLLDQALQLKPDHVDALNNKGVILRERGDLDGAITCYNQAIRIKPDYADAHNNLGIVLRDKGRLDAAAKAYGKALNIKPTYQEAHYNLGNTQFDQGDLQAALNSFRQALAIKPDYADAHCNLGLCLHEQGDLDQAMAAYREAIRLKPSFVQAHLNLGNGLLEIGDLEQAISTYQQALALKPDYAEANWNLSHALMLRGDYQQGWPLYAWRDHKNKKDPTITHAQPACARWQGEAELPAGTNLLVVSEQGLGDTLQFMRYIPVLRQRGLQVRFAAQPRLHTLIQASGIDADPLTPSQADAVSEGLWMPLLSVPQYLGVTPETPIITDAYLHGDSETIQHWKQKLAQEKRPIIAIHWQGNPDQEKGNAKGRSLPLECFAPIAANLKGSLLSLQKGFGAEQLASCSFRDRFVGCQAEIETCWDFLETAAILSQCDLVISSDSALAHLAAGLGRPTWLLLKFTPDWRWGVEGDSSFWYPSMRLFRQRQRGDWPSLIEEVAVALREHFGEPGGDAGAPSPTPQSAGRPPAAAEPAGILAPIALAELIDKITILEIKSEKLSGPGLTNVRAELEALRTTLAGLGLAIEPQLIRRLGEVNRDLWEIEDAIREKERQQDFGEAFIRLARCVYLQNDRRAAIKREINSRHGSELVEVKTYAAY